MLIFHHLSLFSPSLHDHLSPFLMHLFLYHIYIFISSVYMLFISLSYLLLFLYTSSSFNHIFLRISFGVSIFLFPSLYNSFLFIIFLISFINRHPLLSLYYLSYISLSFSIFSLASPTFLFISYHFILFIISLSFYYISHFFLDL